jgi:uncharacterized membrane protein
MYRAVFYLSTLLPVLVLLLVLATWKMRRRPAAFSNEPHAAVRTASLNTPTDNGEKWWLGLLSTLLLLAGTASLLANRWQTIPQRFPIHWGMDGQPNGWVDRTPGSVFGPLLFILTLVAIFGLLGELIARSSPGHEGRTAMIGTIRTILIACAWFVTILLCSTSLLPLAHDPTNFVPLLIMFSVVFSLGIIGYVIYRWTRMGPAIVAGQNSTDSRFWKAGLIYYNPGDSALMVPKRLGFGYTFNFGRPMSWLIFGAILLIPLLLPLLIHASANR